MSETELSIQVRILAAEEAPVLSRVAPDVFDHAVDSRLAREFLRDRRHHLAVALEGDTVVGMASGVDYVHPDKPVELWINEVGIAPSHQRRGIGRRLLRALFEHAARLGCKAAWVGTELDNEAARGLYADLGGEPESSVIYEFDLREGATKARIAEGGV